MKKLCSVLFAVAILFSTVGFADAVYIDQFPSSTSTVVASVGFINTSEIGYFWSVSRGDSVTESFNTGQSAVNGLDLDFNVTRNVLNSGAVVDWDVLVNGISVGGWSWSAGMGTGAVNLSYVFGGIAGGGIYDIAMMVTNQVPGGHGSIALGVPGELALHAVPEPASLLLLGSGLIGLAGFGRKKKEDVC